MQPSGRQIQVTTDSDGSVSIRWVRADGVDLVVTNLPAWAWDSLRQHAQDLLLAQADLAASEPSPAA